MIDNNIYKFEDIYDRCYFKFQNNQHITILKSSIDSYVKGSTYPIKYLDRVYNSFYIQDYEIEYTLVNDLEVLL